MTRDELMTKADALEAEAKALREQAFWLRLDALKAQPLLDRLRFAATVRCHCGAGMAYDPAGEVGGIDSPHHKPNAWDCSAILLGTAVPSGQPGAVMHTGVLPFAFYEVKAEGQASACGRTTRPPAAPPEGQAVLP